LTQFQAIDYIDGKPMKFPTYICRTCWWINVDASTETMAPQGTGTSKNFVIICVQTERKNL